MCSRNRGCEGSILCPRLAAPPRRIFCRAAPLSATVKQADSGAPPVWGPSPGGYPENGIWPVGTSSAAPLSSLLSASQLSFGTLSTVRKIVDEAKTPRVFLQARFTHCATPGIPDFKSRQKGPLPTVRPPSRPRTSRPGGRRRWQLCQLGGDTLFPPRVPGLQRAAAKGHEGAAPRARPPRPAQRPRPRRWNQEAVTWAGADWLLVAGIGAASKLRRRAESTRAQCPRCCAAP